MVTKILKVLGTEATVFKVNDNNVVKITRPEEEYYVVHYNKGNQIKVHKPDLVYIG